MSQKYPLIKFINSGNNDGFCLAAAYSYPF